MTSETYTNHLTGMICPQCEDEILAALLHTRGIISASASYRRSSVSIVYDPELTDPATLERVLENTGYPAGGNGKAGLVSDLASLFSLLLLCFLIPFLTGLVKLPAQTAVTLPALFLTGFFTSVHCIGMCGGIMLTQKNVVVYNGGRLLGYTLAGAVIGFFGAFISYDGAAKSMLFTVSGTLVVMVGLKQWGAGFLRKLSLALQTPCRFHGKAPLLVGLATALMPCGALSAAWLCAASAGSAPGGAAAMLAFGLGTQPLMLLFGSVGKFLPRKYNKYILRAGAVLITALGLQLVFKGLF